MGVQPRESAIRISRLADLAAGDSELIEQLELAPEGGAGDLAVEKLLILLNGLGHQIGCFVQEFETEVTHPELADAGQVLCPGLGEGIKDGVATASVGFDGMPGADAIAQLDLM